MSLKYGVRKSERERVRKRVRKRKIPHVSTGGKLKEAPFLGTGRLRHNVGPHRRVATVGVVDIVGVVGVVDVVGVVLSHSSSSSCDANKRFCFSDEKLDVRDKSRFLRRRRRRFRLI